MRQKERLVELLDSSCCPQKDDYYRYEDYLDALAEYLVYHGVIVPPCKVGDTVYDICGFPKIMKAEVETMTTDGQEMSSVVVKPQKPFHRWFVNWKDIGKTVFLDRKEAEQALKERETK